MRFKRTAIATALTASMLTIGIAVVSWSSAGATAQVDDFSNPGGTQNIRSVFAGTITPNQGAPFNFMMDLVAVNWTASGLVGGGVLNVPQPDPNTYSAIHVTLRPMEDRFGRRRIFTYEGQRCTA